MALKKDYQKSDLTIGNYWRLVVVNLPSIDKDKGIGENGSLGFNIYKDEEAAKVLGADIFATKVIQVPSPCFSPWTLPDTFDEVAAAVYGKKLEILGLEDAEDILE